MRIALRTDASRRIGTGHARRCLSLAHALKAEGADVRFACRAHDEISRVATEGGDTVLWLPAPSGYVASEIDPPHADWAGCGWEQDADETIAALRDWPPDWVLVDHYAFDARWHERVGAALKCRVAVVDDLADRPLACAVVIDQNLHPDPEAKYAPVLRTKARILGGPAYALLAPRYRHPPRYHFRRKVHSIGIFMSGGDPSDFTSRVLRACREVALFHGSIELVSSSRNPNFTRHVKLAKRWPHTRVLHDEPDLAHFFARHDLQIGSGGIAAWERCCVGAPTLALQIAANQRAVLPELARAGAIEWLDRDDPDEQAIGQAVKALLDSPRKRLELVRATRGLVDGLGAARVAAALSLAVDPAVVLRPAALRDEALLLEWANDGEARRHAFRPQQIAPREHHAWFAKRVASPDCVLLIGQSRAGTPVGMVRFERSEDAWTVSYSLDPSFRGLKMARPLLTAAVEVLRAQAPGAKLVAWVKPDNGASLKVFRALGFAERRDQNDGTPCHRFDL